MGFGNLIKENEMKILTYITDNSHNCPECGRGTPKLYLFSAPDNFLPTSVNIENFLYVNKLKYKEVKPYKKFWELEDVDGCKFRCYFWTDILDWDDNKFTEMILKYMEKVHCVRIVDSAISLNIPCII